MGIRSISLTLTGKRRNSKSGKMKQMWERWKSALLNELKANRHPQSGGAVYGENLI